MNLKMIGVYVISYYIAYVLHYIQRVYYVDLQKYLIEKKQLESFDSPPLHLSPLIPLLYSWESFGSQLKLLCTAFIIGTGINLALGFIYA